MTVLVGVRCKDGVVVGADGRATNAMGTQPLIGVRSDKIEIIGDRIIYASTGAVGLGQRVSGIVQQCHDQKLFQNDCSSCCKQITQSAIKDFQSTGVPRHSEFGFGFGAMIAAPFSDDFELVEFGVVDFQPEIKRRKIFCVSMGSGQMLADPFLAFVSRVLWKDEAPDVETAKFGVLWALNHTIQYAPGGVGKPLSLAILKRNGKGKWCAQLLDEQEVLEQHQHIGEIEKLIGEYPHMGIDQAETSKPPIPSSA